MLAPMTTPRTPNPASAPTAPRGEQATAASIRSTRAIALVAALIATVALGLAAWGFLAGGTPGCQQQAWDTAPAAADLPAGWEITAQQYDLERKTMSLLGPILDVDAGSQAVTYATITCFGTGAAESVTLSQQAAADAGQTVTERPDLGDQAYSSTDDTGSVFLQLRHGPIVVYLAASGDASPGEVDQLASAFDKALGGDGGTISDATAEPQPTVDPGESIDPEQSEEAVVESPAAPDLVATLPTKVGDITLVADSATGSSILGEDQGSRAILAALRAEGLDPEALQVAQAYDEQGMSDLAVLAVKVAGMDLAKVEDLVLDSWLAASGAGVARTPVKLGSDEWIVLDYGDGLAKDWVRAADGQVYVITTADEALAEQAAAAIP
jgi:hypothetical protein